MTAVMSNIRSASGAAEYYTQDDYYTEEGHLGDGEGCLYLLDPNYDGPQPDAIVTAESLADGLTGAIFDEPDQQTPGTEVSAEATDSHLDEAIQDDPANPILVDIDAVLEASDVASPDPASNTNQSQTQLDQAQSDQTQPDQTQPDQTQPDPTRAASQTDESPDQVEAGMEAHHADTENVQPRDQKPASETTMDQDPGKGPVLTAGPPATPMHGPDITASTDTPPRLPPSEADQVLAKDSNKVLTAKNQGASSDKKPSEQVAEGGAGFDLVISWPKAASLLAVGDTRVGEVLKDTAQDIAGFIRTDLLSTRQRNEHGDRVLIPMDFVPVYQRHHELNRNGEVDKHTHTLIGHKGLYTDPATGEVTTGAVHNRALWIYQTVLGDLANAQAARAIADLGYDVTLRGPGQGFGIEGIPRDVELNHSTRRAQIDAHTGNNPTATRAERDIAFKKTRASKNTKLDLSAIHKSTIETLKAEGVDLETMKARALERGTGTLSAQPAPPLQSLSERAKAAWSSLKFGVDEVIAAFGQKEAPQPADTAAQAVDAALLKLGSRSATIPKMDLLKELTRANGNLFTLGAYQNRLNELVETRSLVLTPNGGPPVYVAKATLFEELRILEKISNLKADKAPLMTPDTFVARLDALNSDPAGPSITLTDGQHQTLERIMTDPQGLIAVTGFAGSGKTTAMKLTRLLHHGTEAGQGDATTTFGIDRTVSGLGTTNRAAAELSLAQAVDQSATIDRFLIDHGHLLHGKHATLEERATWSNRIVIIDEASLASNTLMEKLLTVLEQLQPAKTVVQGDTSQLSAVARGNPYLLMTLTDETASKTAMTDIVRQQDPRHREAVDALERGYIARAMKLLGPETTQIGLDASGHPLKDPPKDPAAAKAMFDAWLRLGGATNPTLPIITTTHHLRDLTNALVQTHQTTRDVEAGLSRTSINVVVHRTADVVESERSKATSYAPGTVIRAHSKDSVNTINANAELTVLQVARYSNQLHVETRRGRKLTISLDGHGEAGAPYQSYTPITKTFRENDILIAMDGDKQRGIQKHTRFVLEKIGADGTLNLRPADIKDGPMIAVGPDDQLRRYLDHGTTMTIMSAQGATWDKVVGGIFSWNATTGTQGALTVLASRHRQDLAIVTDQVKTLVRGLTQEERSKTSAVVAQAGGLNRTEVGKITLPAGSHQAPFARQVDALPESEKPLKVLIAGTKASPGQVSAALTALDTRRAIGELIATDRNDLHKDVMTWAHAQGVKVTVVKPEWDNLTAPGAIVAPRSAGGGAGEKLTVTNAPHLRDEQLIDKTRPDLLLSIGFAHGMDERARALSIPTVYAVADNAAELLSQPFRTPNVTEKIDRLLPHTKPVTVLVTGKEPHSGTLGATLDAIHQRNTIAQLVVPDQRGLQNDVAAWALRNQVPLKVEAADWTNTSQPGAQVASSDQPDKAGNATPSRVINANQLRDARILAEHPIDLVVTIGAPTHLSAKAEEARLPVLFQQADKTLKPVQPPTLLQGLQSPSARQAARSGLRLLIDIAEKSPDATLAALNAIHARTPIAALHAPTQGQEKGLETALSDWSKSNGVPLNLHAPLWQDITDPKAKVVTPSASDSDLNRTPYVSNAPQLRTEAILDRSGANAVLRVGEGTRTSLIAQTRGMAILVAKGANLLDPHHKPQNPAETNKADGSQKPASARQKPQQQARADQQKSKPPKLADILNDPQKRGDAASRSLADKIAMVRATAKQDVAVREVKPAVVPTRQITH